MAEFSYRAFLSYSSADRALANWLFTRLETYRVPRAVCKAHGLSSNRVGRIFIDREDARTSADVETILARELEKSEHLVVLCTPAAANPASWVGREIEIFRERRGNEAIHAIIGAGSPPNCFPNQLIQREGARVNQPLAADLRREGDGREKATVKLIASLLGVGFDDLWQRERRRRQTQIAQLAAALVAFVIATFGAIGYGLELNERSAWQDQWSAGQLYIDRFVLALDAVPPRWGVHPGVDPKAVDFWRETGSAVPLGAAPAPTRAEIAAGACPRDDFRMLTVEFAPNIYETFTLADAANPCIAAPTRDLGDTAMSRWQAAYRAFFLANPEGAVIAIRDSIHAIVLNTPRTLAILDIENGEISDGVDLPACTSGDAVIPCFNNEIETSPGGEIAVLTSGTFARVIDLRDLRLVRQGIVPNNEYLRRIIPISENTLIAPTLEIMSSRSSGGYYEIILVIDARTLEVRGTIGGQLHRVVGGDRFITLDEQGGQVLWQAPTQCRNCDATQLVAEICRDIRQQTSTQVDAQTFTPIRHVVEACRTH